MADQTNNIFAPSDVEEVQQCIQAALSQQTPLEIVGGGSKRCYGRPVETTHQLNLSRIAGIVDYQPEELILVVKPGTTLTEVQNVLAEKNQVLAFDPPHWGEGATIGGTIATNLSGPGRFRSGAARDHLLGFQAVDGRGEIIRGGGRVVKNVTGYDLSKAMCGSFGTLAVLTELVVKVLPRPEVERTVIVPGMTEAEGSALMVEAAGSSHDVAALAHLPAGVELPKIVQGLASKDAGMTLLKVEGPLPSVEHHCQGLQGLTNKQAVFLEDADSQVLWDAIRELKPLPVTSQTNLWRISIPPTAAPDVWQEFRVLGATQGFMDWGGGLLWVLLPTSRRGQRTHEISQNHGGHARLIRRGNDVYEGEVVFPPLDPVKEELHKNLKQAFDPAGILNPGRMYPEL